MKPWTEKELIAALAKHYAKHYAAIGALCDETLDRSGRLLGEVRKEARAIGDPSCRSTLPIRSWWE